MKIGLFGGSFNPVHTAHIELAKYTVEILALDKLIFIPAFKSLEKLDIHYEDAKDRVKLLELVKPEHTEISLFEIESNYPVPSATTVKHFSSLYPSDELFFLMGEDNLNTLDTWEGIETIKQLCTIVVWSRNKSRNKQNQKLCQQDTKILCLDNQVFDHSSSAFRIKSTENKNMLDQKVWDYICQHNLYGVTG